jgi:hypothetical protein
MAVEEQTNLNITCDNPNCPGNSGLDPAVRTGWLFVSSEVYGDPTVQHVFCSKGCVSAAADNPGVDFPPEHPVGGPQMAPAPAEAPSDDEEAGG